MDDKRDLVRESASCWPWSHIWAKWEDSARVTKHGAFVLDGGQSELAVAQGTEQERRCQRCNLLQKRIAWNK